jgi:Sulfotransferase family
MAKAREQTDIPDIIDGSIEEALERLLHSLNTESQLSEIGAQAVEQRLLRILSNRLRMQRDFALHPEIDDQQIQRPLILTGGPRTGSTKLHKLLAASGDFKFLRYWQGFSLSLRTGSRDECPAERIREASEFIDWYYTQAPQAKLTHEWSTFQPEEEILIFEHCDSLYAPYVGTYAYAPSFLQWWVTQDPKSQLLFVNKGLKYLQWQFYDGDPRPWVLKCPIYQGQEDFLAEVYPDATFAVTHRHPCSTVASTASMAHLVQGSHSNSIAKQVSGAAFLDTLFMASQRHLELRDRCPEMKPLDISYAELTGNAGRVAERIFAHAGMPLSPKARQAIQQWDTDNKIHKLGVHQYSLEEMSLTRAMVEDKYRDYIDRFKRFF